METLFWTLIILAGYSYTGYPLLLLLLLPLSPSRNRRQASGPAEPIQRVSIIITAHNEAPRIAEKIDNTLALNHPGVELEVLVASDASTDATDDIVRRYADRGVMLVRSPERKGKEHAQSLAIAASSGELLVFTDTGTTIPRDSLTKMLTVFSRSDVGALSSIDRVVSSDGTIQGEGLYVRYEMWLRDLESRFNTLVGLSGSFFAARRAVCEDWDSRVPSDFGTALNCARRRLKAVSSREVVGIYRNLADPSKEYARKLRTALRGMVGLRHRCEVLNPFRFGWFAFQVASHKLMRWAVPWFLLGAWLVNLGLLAESRIYVLTAAGLALLFVSPLVVRAIPSLSRIGPLRIAAFFVEANAAVMHAAVRMARGRTMMAWEPSRR